MKLYPKILLIGCFLLLVVFASVFALLWSSSSSSVANSQMQIVGIWKNQHTILDYRRDGTARSWSIEDKIIRSTYSNLTYRIHGDELCIYYSANPKEYIQRLSDAVFGTTTDHYKVVKLSDDELQLLDLVSGVTVVFKRSDQFVLNVSP